MASVSGELIWPKGAVREIDTAAETLHLLNQRCMLFGTGSAVR
jgi:hypothetical protein